MKMKVTISLDAKLAEDVGKVAADRGTTISGLIQDYLLILVSTQKTPETKQRELDALERSFKQFHHRLDVGKRTWKREDLYERD
jgi:hypothetical protein